MDSQGKILSIRNALSVLSADVFYHPLWLHFHTQDPAEAARITGALKREIKQLSANRQWLDACRTAIICAYLQNLDGRVRDALRSLHQAWTIATRRGFTDVKIWTIWGISAVCLQDEEYQKTAEHLQRLEKELNRVSQWVLADLINLVRQSVLEQAGRAGNVIDEPRAAGEDVVGWLYHQLWSWGKPTLLPAPGLWVDQELLTGSSNNRHNSLGKEIDHTTIRPRWRRTFWDTLKSLFHGDVWFERYGDGRRPSSLLVDQPLIPVTSSFLFDKQTTPTVPAKGKMPSLAIYCLGSFEVFLNNHVIDGWNGQKGNLILKYLIANRDRPVAKDILMYLFWPDADSEVARRNLHQAIYVLRQTLRRALPDLQLILFENDCYRINSNVDVWLDFEEFEQFVRLGRDHLKAGRLTEAIDAYGVAEELYRGDFLEEELYDDWPQSKREYYRTLYLEIASEICAHYISEHQTTPAMMLCQKVLARDPCNEQAYRGLIQCYLLQGQRQLAIREYQICVQILKEELGLPPSEETLALYRQIAEK